MHADNLWKASIGSDSLDGEEGVDLSAVSPLLAFKTEYQSINLGTFLSVDWNVVSHLGTSFHYTIRPIS